MQSRQQIDARLARFVATRNAVDVWPGVSAAAFRAAQAEIARVGGSVLRGAPQPVRVELPSGTEAAALGVAGFAAGMAPLLGHWCETGTIAAESVFGRAARIHAFTGIS